MSTPISMTLKYNAKSYKEFKAIERDISKLLQKQYKQAESYNNSMKRPHPCITYSILSHNFLQNTYWFSP